MALRIPPLPAIDENEETHEAESPRSIDGTSHSDDTRTMSSMSFADPDYGHRTLSSALISCLQDEGISGHIENLLRNI